MKGMKILFDQFAIVVTITHLKFIMYYTIYKLILIMDLKLEWKYKNGKKLRSDAFGEAYLLIHKFSNVLRNFGENNSEFN